MTQHLYDIHGIIVISSARRLPEIEAFRVEQLPRSVDVDVRVSARPLHKPDSETIRYSEVFGPAGFAMAIDRNARMTTVRVSPLVGASPHVLYTNVVEPLLRWEFVRRGYVLMHGACIAIDGRATFITARTDTGKTTTILLLLRNSDGDIRFVSDDMTILAPDGRVLSYPKPLTISQHTVQAVSTSTLTPWERLTLPLQSRLHSRGGRRIGLWLSRVKTPAATLNAWVQMIVPPPKYGIGKLVPFAPQAHTARLERIVLIERGPFDVTEHLAQEELANILGATSDDAYGFPPYPTLEHEFRTWNGSDLKKEEEQIVSSVVRDIPGTRLVRTGYEWEGTIVQMLRGDPAASVRQEDEPVHHEVSPIDTKLHGSETPFTS